MRNVVPGDVFHARFASSTGGLDMNVDASTAAKSFTVTPSTTKDPAAVAITHMVLVVVDANAQYGKFGGIAALTNGLLVRALTSTGGVLKNFTADAAIKTNEDFNYFAESTQVVEPAAGDDLVASHWALDDAIGHPMQLEQGQTLEVRVQDDLSALTKFGGVVFGHYVAKGSKL